MRRSVLAFSMVAVLAMVATSCKKDNDGFVTLSAQLENIGGSSAKVHMEGNLPVWNSGDEVKVNDVTGTVSVTGSGDNRTASISGNFGDGPYYAVYPASIVSGEVGATATITLPAEQAYETYADGSQKVQMPMVAVATSGTTLQFYNLCSLVKVTVNNSTGSAFTLDAIRLSSGPWPDNANTMRLSGTGTANLSNHTLSLAASGSQQVSLTFEDGLTVASEDDTTVYIVVPTVSTSCSLSVELVTRTGIAVKTKSSVTIVRNKIYPMTFSATALEAGLSITAGSGVFTVASGKTVKFATGNLLYNGTNYTTHTHQYDYVSSSTNAAANMGFFPQEYRSNITGHFQIRDDGDDEEVMPFVDWGDMFYTNNKHWRTLTESEWYYLTSTTHGRRGNTCIEVKVNDTPGLLLLPDDYVCPDGVTLPTTGYWEPVNSWNSVVTYNLAQWAILENSGCVFLPAAGNDYGNRRIFGAYWTSTRPVANQIYFFEFSTTSISYTHANFDNEMGCLDSWCSVRLVQDCD